MEAGARAGGRVLTSEFAGHRVEMGATWVQGVDGSPVHALARDAGALGRYWLAHPMVQARVNKLASGRPDVDAYGRLAELLGAPPPRFTPPATAEPNRRVANGKAVAALGFAPRFGDYRKGLAQASGTA